MAITNPSPNSGHKVFKRTFLQQTEVNVRFAPVLSPSDFRERIIPFAKQHFGQEININPESDANHAKMEAAGEEKQYTFDIRTAHIVIGPRSYETFAQTVLPLLPRIQAFLRDVAQVDSCLELAIVKRNAWPVKANNAFESFTEALGFVFKDEYVSDLVRSYKYAPENPRPIQTTKFWATDICEGAKLDTKIVAEVTDKDNLFFELALEAAVSNVAIEDMLADALVLNDIIYTKFIDVISEDVIDIMTNENE